MTEAPITWRETRQRLTADRARIREALRAPAAEGSFMRLLFPGYLCVWLFRCSHYCYARGRRRLARVFWTLNVFLTGADIAPASEIRGGLYIPHPAGVTLNCKAGRNLTVMALSGTGPVYGRNGEVLERLPVLGDTVTLQHHSGIYGAA
jgi:serine O-acetyltransferase